MSLITSALKKRRISGVVGIYYRRADSCYSFIGSGFLISPHQVITASHLLVIRNPANATEQALLSPDSEEEFEENPFHGDLRFPLREIFVCIRDGVYVPIDLKKTILLDEFSHDLAILHIPENLNNSIDYLPLV